MFYNEEIFFPLLLISLLLWHEGITAFELRLMFHTYNSMCARAHVKVKIRPFVGGAKILEISIYHIYGPVQDHVSPLQCFKISTLIIFIRRETRHLEFFTESRWRKCKTTYLSLRRRRLPAVLLFFLRESSRLHFLKTSLIFLLY